MLLIRGEVMKHLSLRLRASNAEDKYESETIIDQGREATAQSYGRVWFVSLNGHRQAKPTVVI